MGSRMTVDAKMAYMAFLVVTGWNFQNGLAGKRNYEYEPVDHPTPSGWRKLCVTPTKKCYIISPVRTTYDDAGFTCHRHNQCLVVLETDEEERELNNELQSHFDENVDYWLSIWEDYGEWYYHDVPCNKEWEPVTRVNWDSECSADGSVAYGNSRRSKWCRTSDDDRHYVICESLYFPPPPRMSPVPIPRPVVTARPIVPPETALCHNGACYSRLGSGLFTLGRIWHERSVLGCAVSCYTKEECAGFSFAKSSNTCRVLLTDSAPQEGSSLNCEYHVCYMMYT